MDKVALQASGVTACRLDPSKRSVPRALSTGTPPVQRGRPMGQWCQPKQVCLGGGWGRDESRWRKG